nr:restriction endonuclease [uncultured Duganella sp.]
MRALENISPSEFEQHVRDLLSSAGGELSEFSVSRLEHIEGAGGEYEIDVIARLTIFEAADLIVLVECKHHKNPIKRDVVMVLESKLRDTKAHKGMIFATCDFQSGALEFARTHRIATVRVTDGGMTSLTRSFPAIADMSDTGFASWFCEPTDEGLYSMRVLGVDQPHVLSNWLSSQDGECG